MKKFMFICMALLVCGTLCAKKIKLAPGTSCYAWSANTKNKPDTVPNGGFVDEATAFCGKNIHVCDELRNIHGKCFIMWEGYLQIPKAGDYRFTLNMYDNWAGKNTNIKIFIDKKVLFTRNIGDGITMTAKATLKRGFVKIRIYFNFPSHNGYEFGHSGFTIKYAPLNAMKMKDITPAKLYHPVSEEE